MTIELNSFQTNMQALCNCSSVVDKVSTGPCHQNNLGLILYVYTMMIKSKFHCVEHHLCSYLSCMLKLLHTHLEC